MKIVILDGFTLNPGDLDWGELERLGDLQEYDRTPQDKVIERALGAEIVFTNKTVLGADILAGLPELKYIGVLATGYDVVDVLSAGERGVVGTNVPGYGPESVAQMVFAHILNITNNVAAHAQDVSKGGWSSNDDFCYWLTPQIELKGKGLGIIGYGEIGRAVASLGNAFGMNIFINSRTAPQQLPEHYQVMDLETLLSTADIVSLHCPLTEHTRHMINEKKLQLMKPSAILINCSRGPLIDETSLAKALEENVIAAAGLDVLTIEPPLQENVLFNTKHCYITPHIAWATKEARARLMGIAIDNLKAFLQGKGVNVVT